jgi:phosphate transport system protein
MPSANHVVPHFQDELELLKVRLLTMGGLAEERLRTAMGALVDRDGDLLDAVEAGDEPLNRLHIEIDSQALRLLALHQPMAVDLRMVVAAIKINTDLERVGDLAVNIAQASQRYLAYTPVKPLLDLPHMARIAQGMLRDSLDAFVRRDLILSREVLARDDQLDDLKTVIFRELLRHMLGDAATVAPSLELILISRHLERIGDHATNIAEDVIFMVSAEDVRHGPRDPSPHR